MPFLELFGPTDQTNTSNFDYLGNRTTATTADIPSSPDLMATRAGLCDTTATPWMK